MQNRQLGRLRSLLWLGGIVAVAVPIGVWLWQGESSNLQRLTVGTLTLTVVLGGVWQFRARGQRRLHAALDAYAASQIARAPGRNSPRRRAAHSTSKHAAQGRSLNQRSEQTKRAYSRRKMHACPQSQNR